MQEGALHVIAKTEPYVPALYVFGASLVDAGNNNYIPNCTERADFIPYGVSYFPYPTGRFTKGRTPLDFLASCLGLPFPPPYLQPEEINFASSRSGLLDTRGASQNVMSINQQVSLFEEYSDSLTEAEQANLGNSLFSIAAGGSDILSFFSYLFINKTSQSEFTALLLSKLDEYITRLYHRGARKFIVFNIPPLGCSPTARPLVKILNKRGCFTLINRVIESYNIAFNASLTGLTQNLDGATIIQDLTILHRHAVDRETLVQK
ncbi:hypothetical protein SUGI_0684010 [Cryptomeria japonica]|nr:hypothetical protein SUGI_0684010 [Cryptomeria japonica]